MKTYTMKEVSELTEITKKQFIAFRTANLIHYLSEYNGKTNKNITC